MEFKFREIDDRTAPFRSSPSPSSQSSGYLFDQALRGNYSMDPNFLNNPRHFYTIQREIEKQIIRHEIITHEMITAEIERRRLLEEEVRRELMIEREMAMYRAREMGLSIDDRFLMQLHTSYPLMRQFNNYWLEDRFPFPWNPSMGFGNNGLPPNFLPHISHGPWSGSEVNKKDKLIMLPKPDSSICGSKQKAATPPAGSGELASTSSDKPKEWSCALCQVSASTERGLDVHLQGKKHKAKEKLLRDLKMCINSTSKKTKESKDSAEEEMKPNVEEKSVKANKTVVGFDQKVESDQTLQVKPNSDLCGSNQKVAGPSAGSGELPLANSNKPKEWSCALCQVNAASERGINEHLQGRKHKAKVAGLLRDKKVCGNSSSSTSEKSTENRDGLGQEMKTNVQEELVKANKTVVGLNQKVEGGLDEHPQGKNQKAKEEELLGDQKWIKKSTESRDSAGQEMKTEVEEESVKANRTFVGLDQKGEGCQGEHLQGKTHKAKEAELIRALKMCTYSFSSTSKESGKTLRPESAGQAMKSKVEAESVKAIKTVVGLDQKVEGEEDSENKSEELLKKELNANTQKATNGMPTAETMKRNLPHRENFEFWCEVCQVGTHSAVVMQDHKRGKKHMAWTNKSKENDQAAPPTTSMTIVTPSEPTESVEYEDVVAEESNDETAENAIEKADDEEVVVYRGR